ncbi:MAG: hypothetical protein AB1728_05255, partial [Bacteroidota bacterium]
MKYKMFLIDSYGERIPIDVCRDESNHEPFDASRLKTNRDLLNVTGVFSCHSRESGNPEKWMPTYAGMSNVILL